jgi:hypothetical protein
MSESDLALDLDLIAELEEMEELLDHAEQNVTGLILGTAAFCREHKISFADWVTFVGTRVAPTWDAVLGRGPKEVARLVALNVIASGGDLFELEGDDSRAELRCSWPAIEDLEHFDLSRQDLDPFMYIYVPIAAQLGLRYEAHRKGDTITLVFSR